MDRKQFAALLGFLFVAAWIAFNFGYAILCLVGAGVFYVGMAVAQGEVDVGDLQGRLGSGGGSAGASPAAPRARRVR